MVTKSEQISSCSTIIYVHTILMLCIKNIHTHFLSIVLIIIWQLYYQVFSFGMIVSSALMIWKGLMVVTGSENPTVVVLRLVI